MNAYSILLRDNAGRLICSVGFRSDEKQTIIARIVRELGKELSKDTYNQWTIVEKETK